MRVIIFGLLYVSVIFCVVKIINAAGAAAPAAAAAAATAATPAAGAAATTGNTTAGTAASTNSTDNKTLAVNGTGVCKPNQTEANSGFSCLTCARPNGPCNLNFTQGCYCNVGYVMSAGGECLLPDDCTDADRCGPNESYSHRGFDCLTCDNYKNLTCMVTNAPKCYCNVGFVRDDYNHCVNTTDCPNYPGGNCRVNQTFSAIGYDCLTCSNFNGENQGCTLTRQLKCYCRSGYVRYSDNDRCVLPEDCNSIDNGCPPNESLQQWARECKCNGQCVQIRDTKCSCNTGYVRSDSGQCVTPISCNGNSYNPFNWNTGIGSSSIGGSSGVFTGPNSGNAINCRDLIAGVCGRGCILSCANTYRRRLTCPGSCDACACGAGEVRNDYTGQCILRNTCPRMDLISRYDNFGAVNSNNPNNWNTGIGSFGVGSTSSIGGSSGVGTGSNSENANNCRDLITGACGRGCILSCANTYRRRLTCPGSCDACACAAGEVRNDYTGQCILRNTCPRMDLPYRYDNFGVNVY